MSCYHPLSAIVYTHKDGSRSVRVLGAYKGAHNIEIPSVFSASADWQHILLPCGHCMFCRLRRSLEWTIRCFHEQSLHSSPGSFVTLTFDEASVPRLPDGQLTLDYRPFQLFLKRLRKRFQSAGIRFLMCGEYGSRTQRPHYHAILFGFQFPDAVPFGRYYRSAILEQLWPYGISTIGNVTHHSISYVCRYSLKKQVGKSADDYYRGRMPEFVRMSNRPGIGADWLTRYNLDVYKVDKLTDEVLRDAVRYRGHDSRPPRYYDKVLGRQSSDVWDIIHAAREEYAREQPLPTVEELQAAGEHARHVAGQAYRDACIRRKVDGCSSI